VQQGRKKGGKASTLDHVDKEGAGQAALVGVPNSGKSSIVAATTAAAAQVADYPFSTLKPVAGMLAYQDIQIQLVDLPPVTEDYTESWVYNVIRTADVVLLTVDLSQPQPEEQVLEVSALFEAHNLLLTGSRDAEAPSLSVAPKYAVILGTKQDAPGAAEGLKSLQEAYGEEFEVLSLSVASGHHMDELPRRLFRALDIVRIYTKAPGKRPDMDRPYILPAGSTVQEVAAEIHRDLAESFRFAKIWGSEKYDGQQVKRDHVVEDGDVLEIHG
jgi:ribosome-interacting GTPase 1